MSLVIAEIGNCHFGDFEEAKHMILEAKRCGAFAVKGQAFEASDVSKYGSMNPRFYKQCQFTPEQCIDLIYFARSNGIEMFYSIFSRKYECLLYHQKYFKIAAKQTGLPFFETELKDSFNSFVSISDVSPRPNLKRANILYACPYPPAMPRLETILDLSNHYGMPVGFSDHTPGIEKAVEAVKKYHSPFIEKHFTLYNDRKWHGQRFRDNSFAATPMELKQLCEEIQNGLPTLHK